MKFFGSLWSSLSKKHEKIIPYFQMCLMARLKALTNMRWNLGSDIILNELRSSAMVLIDVYYTANIMPVKPKGLACVHTWSP